MVAGGARRLRAVFGVPASPGGVGWLLLGAGALAALAVCSALRSRLARLPAPVAASVVCLVVSCALVPFVARRFVQDMRVTTRLHGYDAAAAGPVQAYLPGYLVDGAKPLIPRGATFATVVAPGIRWAPARAAFPSLAMQTLFPRISVASTARADYVVTWGVLPGRVVPVSHSWVARRRAGAYLAVYVGKVRR